MMDPIKTAVIFLISSLSLCSSSPIDERDLCPTGCTCIPTDQSTPLSVIFDSIYCDSVFLTSNDNETQIPAVKHLSFNCIKSATNVEVSTDYDDVTISFKEIFQHLAYPSILEALSVASCKILEENEGLNSISVQFDMLKSIQIDSCNLTTFDPSILQNLCSLEQVQLSNNIGLNFLMRNVSESDEITMTTAPLLLEDIASKATETDTTTAPSTSKPTIATATGLSTSKPIATATLLAPLLTSTLQSNCSFSNVTLLDLSGNALKNINLSFFPFIQEIKELNLENNNLQNSMNISLREVGLASLETINLAYNDMSTIFPDLFINLPNLCTINMSHNSISDPSFLLTGTPIVKTLDLSYNNIQYLSVELLQEMDTIQELYLSHNNMIAVTQGIQYFYIYCPQIAIVDISFNQLKYIDEFLFGDLQHLESVDLSNNHLESISQSAFIGVERLQYLNLSYNNLSNFQFFTELNEDTDYVINVDMHGNPLNCDCEMSRLLLASRDSANQNLINWPYSSAFVKQRFLNYESLVCEKTHSTVYFLGTNLTVEFLTENPSYFQCDDDQCPVNTSCSCTKGLYFNSIFLYTTFCGYQNLTTIPQDVNPYTGIYVLAGNGLQQINSYSFHNLEFLNTLVLSYNIISTIEEDAFYGLNNLTQLYLPYNNLSAIKSSYFKLMDLLTYLELQINEILYIEPGSFDDLFNLQYLDLSNNQITSLPDPFLYSQNMVYLYLQNNSLEQLPTTFVAKSPIHLYTGPLVYSYITLDLSDNQLTSIPDGVFDSDNMTETWQLIFLANNYLTSLPDNAFKQISSDLMFLDIHNNNLTTLPESMFDYFQSNIEVFLHNNPWVCDCRLQWLSTYLYGNGSQPRWAFLEVDPYIIYCDQINDQATHTPIWNVTGEEFCPNITMEVDTQNVQVFVVAATSSLAAVIILGVFTSILVYRNRRFIRQVSHHLCGCWIPYERNRFDSALISYKYDIFISHDSSDLDFILQTLLPKLHMEKYKTHVHEINNKPGESILESIANAIQSSKRILVVLSQNYVNNEQTAGFEFNHALMQSMRQRADTLLIIQLDDLDHEHIPPNIKAYMGQKNWIKYDETNRLFWANLLEQLHQPKKNLQRSDMDLVFDNLGINAQAMEENAM